MPAAASISGLRDIRLLLLVSASDEEGQHGCNEEEDAVHDAKRPTRLEHRTGLINGDPVAIVIDLAIDTQACAVTDAREA